MTRLEADFSKAMMNIYLSAKKIGYTPSIFHRMLMQNGAIATANQLINSSTVSEGYTRLFELERLDLTVEAVIYENDKWHQLFTIEELMICKKRLTEYRYAPRSPVLKD